MNSPASSAEAEMPRRPDNVALPDEKKLRLDTSADRNSGGIETGRATSTAAGEAHSEASSFDGLPAVVVIQIAAFSPASSLSGACRSTLSAIRRLHYKVNLRTSDLMSNLDGHMGLKASGALATGRMVTRITVNVIGQEYQVIYPDNNCLEEAVKRVVRHSIPTLRWITVKGDARDNGRTRVAPIIGELVPLSAKHHRVAPQLKRVELMAGATGVAKAGKAVAAGLWPALEVLSFTHCRANAGHFKDLADGILAGRVPNLRSLEWDDQSCIRKKPVDDVILAALAGGACPRLKSISFKDNRFCPEYSILYLEDALRACPNLRVLAMDCSRKPCMQLRDLARALRKGWVPKLDFLYVRATAPYYRGSDVELKALREAAASREPPVMLVSEIKTRLPPQDVEEE
eukprot:g9587.t1